MDVVTGHASVTAPGLPAAELAGERTASFGLKQVWLALTPPTGRRIGGACLVITAIPGVPAG